MSVSVGCRGRKWRAYLCFKCSSMFFTSWESFDKNGHLMKDKQIAAKSRRQGVQHMMFESINVYLLIKCLFDPQTGKEHQFTVTTRKALLEYSCHSFSEQQEAFMMNEWMRSMSAFHVLAQSECVSMSDLLSAPSGHSLGSQPQDLREQLAMFVPAEGHPVWGRGRDARGENRLVEGLLERDGVWGGWGEGEESAFIVISLWRSELHSFFSFYI